MDVGNIHSTFSIQHYRNKLFVYNLHLAPPTSKSIHATSFYHFLTPTFEIVKFFDSLKRIPEETIL